MTPMQFQQYIDRAWRLVYTRYKSEKQVRAILEENGISCYLPLIKHVHSKYRTTYRPIFDGYLFVPGDRKSELF